MEGKGNEDGFRLLDDVKSRVFREEVRAVLVTVRAM